jgi:hypothetical protein
VLKIFFWGLSVVLMIAVAFNVALLYADYDQALMFVGFLTFGFTGFAVAAVAANVSDPKVDPTTVKEAIPTVCGLISVASAAAVAFAMQFPFLQVFAIGLATVFAIFAAYLATLVVRSVTQGRVGFNKKVATAFALLAFETVLIFFILMPRA